MICLQEVPQQWIGRLITFFNAKGYNLINSLYGKAFNGFMGIAIAYPRDKFKLLDADISRISDAKTWQEKPSFEKKVSKIVNNYVPTSPIRYFIMWMYKLIMNVLVFLWSFVMEKCLKQTKDTLQDDWDHAKARFNTVIFTRLLHLSTNKKICISTVHLPCAFRSPRVMHIHAALTGQRVQSLAGNNPNSPNLISYSPLVNSIFKITSDITLC